MQNKSNYRELKGNKGTVVIKVEEVLVPVFIRGRLSKQEMQIVFAIIADSWRWRNEQYTQRAIRLKTLSEDTGIEYTRVTRIWKSLVQRNVIRLDKNQRASFNEHWHEWKVAETATPRKVVDPATRLAKRARSTAKSATPTPSNQKDDSKIQIPKNNYKNNVKNNKRGAQKKRAPVHPHFQEFVGWWKHIWSEHNNGKPYVWTDLDGTHLKRLLGGIGFDDLEARAQYAFRNAGKAGRLSWFQPPFTFQEFASSKVINKCSGESEGSAGYDDADVFMEQEQECEIATSD